MSKRDIGRRFPASRTVVRPQRPSPLSRGRRTSVRPQPSPRPTRPANTSSSLLRRCNSAPIILWRISSGVSGDDHRRMTTAAAADEEEKEVLFRPQTCTDLFASPDYYYSVPPSPRKCSEVVGLNKDAKVVVSVTVEGSPGPVRTMLKLGCSVEDAIRLVVRKYNSEGRTPLLNNDAAASTFELHRSYFSLQSLDNSDVIGNIGSRNLYLRKISSKGEAELACIDDPDSSISKDDRGRNLIVFPGFFAMKINQIIRRSRKLWRLLGCLQSTG